MEVVESGDGGGQVSLRMVQLLDITRYLLHLKAHPYIEYFCIYCLFIYIEECVLTSLYTDTYLNYTEFYHLDIYSFIYLSIYIEESHQNITSMCLYRSIFIRGSLNQLNTSPTDHLL